MKFLKLVIFRPLIKYTFSATEEPLIEARLPKAESPSVEPGANNTNEVRSLATGVTPNSSSTSIVRPVVVLEKS